jgi:hypothetical protein
MKGIILNDVLSPYNNKNCIILLLLGIEHKRLFKLFNKDDPVSKDIIFPIMGSAVKFLVK